MIDLRRGKSHLSCSGTIWAMSIEMARLCGWVPAGTRRTIEKPVADDLDYLLAWQVEYVCQDGQTVTAKDAAHLADGLTRALLEGQVLLDGWNHGQLEPPAKLRTPSTGFVWFDTDDGKDHLRKLAAFCRAGEFQIC